MGIETWHQKRVCTWSACSESGTSSKRQRREKCAIFESDNHHNSQHRQESPLVENNECNTTGSWTTMTVPKGFLCPLTLEVMLEPVLDAEGNTYERSALLKWIQEYRTSPISRQPLSETMLVPNNALRDTIHEFMGQEWVLHEQSKSKTEESTKPPLESSPNNQHCNKSSCGNKFSGPRAKIDCFLQFVAQHLSGSLSLNLNDKGCCAFRFQDMVVVVDVPEKGELFSLYTRNIVSELTEPMKDMLLEMNYLQGDTRGGCVSVKKGAQTGAVTPSEVMFSYTDRVAEVSAKDFLNIVLNFLETAVSVRQKLVSLRPHNDNHHCHVTTETEQTVEDEFSSRSNKSTKTTTSTKKAKRTSAPNNYLVVS